MTNRPAFVAPPHASPVLRPRVFGLPLLAFLLLLPSPCPALSAEAVRVGVYDNPPLVFQDQTGQARGMAIDLLADIAGKEGWQLQYVPGTRAEGLARLDRGEIDLLPAMVLASELGQRYAVNKETLLTDWGRLYTFPGSGVVSVLDLNGRQVAIRDDDPHALALQDILTKFNIQATLVKVTSYAEVLQLVASRQVDAGLANRLFECQSTHPDGVEATPILINPTELRYAGPSNKNSRVLLTIDHHLTAQKADNQSAFHQALGKWLGNQAQGRRPAPRWVWGAVLAGAALLLLFFGTTLMLRAQVRRRTKELRQTNAELRREIQVRLQAQLESMSNETKYRLVVDYANEAIFLLQDGIIKFPNPKTEAMLGFAERELADLPFLDLVHPDDRDMVSARIKALEQGDAITSTYAFRIMNRDGKELQVQQNDVFTVWENRPTVLCFLRDVSAQKQMEAQIQQAQKMEAIGTLAGGVAHDFNNLLTGIQGRAALLLMDLDPSHPHFRDLQEIMAISKSAENLTRQLLGFARGGKYEVEAIDLNALVADTLNMFGRTRKGIAIHKYLGEDLPAVDADRGQMSQVFLNLFVNAAQAMPTGGAITVESKDIRLHEEFVRPHQVKPGKFVKVTVTDTGNGMDEATRQHIFDPFFTTKSRERGTGLGLASVYGIVKHHGGIITVKSDQGRGTTFTIFLPASDKTARPKKPPAQGAVKGEGTILLVDDEKMVVEAGRLMLQTLGYTVLTAYSGMEALSILKAKPADIDLVLLDIIMPGMDGSEVFQAMHAIHPEVKVLLASGYSIEHQTQKILASGCAGFIQKPFSLRELSVKIHEILTKK